MQGVATMIIDIEAELASYESRESVFEKIGKAFKKITKKNVYPDFAFPRCGKVMGLVRHILQNPKQEDKLLAICKLKKSQIEFFRDNAGNTSYLSADNEIVKAKEIDIKRTQAIVKLIAKQLDMALEDEDILREINEERWKSIVKMSEKRAKTAKKLSKLVKTDIVIEE